MFFRSGHPGGNWNHPPEWKKEDWAGRAGSWWAGIGGGERHELQQMRLAVFSEEVRRLPGNAPVPELGRGGGQLQRRRRFCLLRRSTLRLVVEVDLLFCLPPPAAFSSRSAEWFFSACR